MRPKSILAIVLAAALVGAAGGFLGARIVYRELLDKVDLLTPVAVLDASAALEPLNVRSSGQEVADVLESIQDKADRLKAAGFIVLKPNAVLATPEAVHVRLDRPSEIQNP